MHADAMNDGRKGRRAPSLSEEVERSLDLLERSTIDIVLSSKASTSNLPFQITSWSFEGLLRAMVQMMVST